MEIDSALWWPTEERTRAQIAEDICRKHQPDIYTWLHDQPLHPWKFDLETVQDMHGDFMLFIASVTFRRKSDAALFLLAFGGRDRSRSERLT